MRHVVATRKQTDFAVTEYKHEERKHVHTLLLPNVTDGYLAQADSLTYGVYNATRDVYTKVTPKVLTCSL